MRGGGSFWRRRRSWLLGGGFVLLLLLGIEGYRYVSAVLAVRSGRDLAVSARQLLTSNVGTLSAQRLDEARADLAGAEADFGASSDILRDGWLAQMGTHLPWISDQLDGANALRTAGRSGTALGVDVIGLVRAVLQPTSSPGTSGSPLQRVVALADQHSADVTRAATDLAAFQQALGAVPHTSLAGPLESARQTLLKDGGELTGAVGPALTILNALPAAIGPGQHTYIILLNNPGEEYPGGGYIGAVGVVTFTDGALAGLQFADSSVYPPVASIPIPDALNRYVFQGKPWELGNANWSPDFPASMSDINRFYTADTGRTVNGDISIDPVAISYLLGLLGPEKVAPYPQVLTSANVLKELNFIANKVRPGDPGKVYLSALGQQLTQQILGEPAAQLAKLASVLERGAQEKHAVLFFTDPTLERLVTGAGFGGALTAPSTDSVMVDDANLSGNKADLFVQRSFHLDVRVSPDGNATDTLTLTYTNPVVSTFPDSALEPTGRNQYRDYLRLVLPETAQLQGLTASIDGAPPQPVAWSDLSYQFEQLLPAFWFVVPAGGTEQLTVTYTAPVADVSVTPEEYTLTWLKQVNALPWPVDVTVHMPSGRTAHWSASLTADQHWSLAN